MTDGTQPVSTQMVVGQVIEDVTIAPGKPWGRVVKAGQHLRIIDLQGQQAVDFLCYDAADPHDRYNAANTMKLASSIYVEKGTTLWSDRARKLMTVVGDSCGRHDTIGGCCSAEINELRYTVKGTRNCRDTFEEALKPFGLGRDDIVSNVNWFMYVPVRADGHMAIVDGISKPGDYVDLLAERDVICVVSNCAQIYNPCNGFNPTPVRIITYLPQ
ncbi:MAG: DUF1989 domain-containing protein [Alphaproteobacteria bacterium]